MDLFVMERKRNYSNSSDSNDSVQEFGDSSTKECEQDVDESEEYLEDSDDGDTSDMEEMEIMNRLEILNGNFNEESSFESFFEINSELKSLMESHVMKIFLDGKRLIPVQLKEWCMSVELFFSFNKFIIYMLHDERLSLPDKVWIQTHSGGNKSWKVDEKYSIKTNYKFDLKIVKVRTKLVQGFYFMDLPKFKEEDLLALSSGLDINVKGILFKKIE